jgi:hypothetical protein
MADDRDASGGAESSAPARPAASFVPRDKPLIEGQAEEIRSENPPDNVTGGDLFAPLIPPQETEAAGPIPEAEVAPAKPRSEAAPPRKTAGAALWPIAAAIVIAALIAVGGAFALHRLDKTPAHLAALESLVGTLEHRSDATQGLAAAQRDLAARVTALEAASHDTQAALAGLRTDLDKLVTQKSTPSAAPDLAPLAARLAALEQKLAALDTKTSGLAGRLNAENGQAQATANRVRQSAVARADSEAIAILAANLLRKVDAGVPYDTDLEALANRGHDKEKLAPLEPAAASGVATPAALATQFSGLSPAILATEPEPSENGFFNHLVKDAERLVRVRKVGETSGNDLSSRVARIQAALDSGAVDAAYRQWNALPGAAKAKSAAFGTAAKARIDAIAAARSIDAEAVAALGKARS